MLYAGWIIAMGAYWSRRNELVMRVRSPAMVMMHATYAMMVLYPCVAVIAPSHTNRCHSLDDHHDVCA